MKAILTIVTCFSILALSCSKENSNEFVPYPGYGINDTNWYSVVPQSARVRQLDSVFAITPLSDSVSVITGGTIVLGDSIKIDLPPGFCAGGAGTTIQKVNIEVIVLRTKGDMVKADRPTMSYDKLLVTGGALHIRATYNGQSIPMAQGKTIQVSMITKMSNNNPSQNMHVFHGKEDAYPATAVQTFTWIPWQDTVASWVNTFQGASGLTGYQFFTDRFGWVNCDYFSDTTQPRTKVSVVLPPNFTNANTNVYAVLQTPDIVAQLIPDPVSKTFDINNIYVGKVVTFVSLSYIDGKLYLGTKQETIGNNMSVNLTPALSTKPQIETFLQNL